MIKLHVSFGTSLYDKVLLNRLQKTLHQLAPKWTTGLYRYEWRKPKRLVPWNAADALYNAAGEELMSVAVPPQRQAEHANSASSNRLFGMIELRGFRDWLVVVLHFDEHVYARKQTSWWFGNSISFHVCGSRAESGSATEWAASAFEALCREFAPLYGRASSEEEYDAKNICKENGIRAIGVDISRHLPGLYWYNFFGNRHADFMGRSRLLSAPALRVVDTTGGVILQMDKDPFRWIQPDYKERERAVLAAVGHKYFFDRSEPNRATEAPEIPTFGA